MKKPKLNPIYKSLPGGLGVLQILLKEVLQQTPPDMADRLAEYIRNGVSLNLIVGENSRGRGHKCAFRWEIDDDESWRTADVAAIPILSGNIQ